jgi:hypothetical protein
MSMLEELVRVTNLEDAKIKEEFGAPKAAVLKVLKHYVLREMLEENAEAGAAKKAAGKKPAAEKKASAEKKSGAPKKAAKAKAPKAKAASADAASAEAPVSDAPASAPKKRGRKPKSAAVPAAAPAESIDPFHED